MTNYVGQQFGNYRLVQLVGTGGFAEVYLGEHIHLGMSAAIKILNARLQQQEAQLFRDEARTIARLIHPNIIRLLEFGIEGTTPFMVIDYAPNGTVKARHPKGTPLPLPTLISYVKQIADALQFAHDEKVIHRDIKPENILLGRRNEILLTDFGIAVIAHSTLSRKTVNFAGTPAYMAPEQIQQHPIAASDQYALGVMVYQWLCGSPPFEGTGTEIAIKHLSVPPPPLTTKNPSLPAAVEQVVMRTLAKDPKQRFASVQEFAHAFEQASQPLTTICTRCGNLLNPTKKFCGKCGTPNSLLNSSVPTIVVPNVGNPLTLPVNTPTPPLIIKNPTPQQINAAMVATVNPYGEGQWGNLVVDGSNKNVWDFPAKGRKYQDDLRVQNAGLLTTLTGKGMHIMPGIAYEDIAYQVYVSLPDSYGIAGITCRVDEVQDECLQFSVVHVSTSSPAHFVVDVSNVSYIGRSKERLYPTDSTEAKRTFPGKSFLFAIVVQGITVDFYIDLVHVKRVYTRFSWKGSIGILNDYTNLSHSSEFRYTKLWIKKP